MHAQEDRSPKEKYSVLSVDLCFRAFLKSGLLISDLFCFQILG
jgi:hypothetical protein